MQNLQNMASFKQARKEKGFTIIELVVVILLLGILAATALPRFMDVTDEAHTAVVDAVEGGLGTGAALFRAQWFAKGQPLDPVPVPEFGNGVLTANTNGYPLVDDTSADCKATFEELLQASGAPSVTTFDTSVGVDGAPALVSGGTPTVSALEIIVTPELTAANIASVATGDFVTVKVNNGGSVFCTNSGDDATCDDADLYSTAGLAEADAGGDVADLDTALATFAASGGSCEFYYTGQFKTESASLIGGYSADGDVLGLEKLTLSLTTGAISRSMRAFTPGS